MATSPPGSQGRYRPRGTQRSPRPRFPETPRYVSKSDAIAGVARSVVLASRPRAILLALWTKIRDSACRRPQRLGRWCGWQRFVARPVRIVFWAPARAFRAIEAVCGRTRAIRAICCVAHQGVKARRSTTGPAIAPTVSRWKGRCVVALDKQVFENCQVLRISHQDCVGTFVFPPRRSMGALFLIGFRRLRFSTAPPAETEGTFLLELVGMTD